MPNGVSDGDQTRDDLAKVLDSARKALKDKKSVLKTFTDAKIILDTKVKAVTDAVSAKAQADAQAAQQAAEAKANVQTATTSGVGYRNSAGSNSGRCIPARGDNAPSNDKGGGNHQWGCTMYNSTGTGSCVSSGCTTIIDF